MLSQRFWPERLHGYIEEGDGYVENVHITQIIYFQNYPIKSEKSMYFHAIT